MKSWTKNELARLMVCVNAILDSSSLRPRELMKLKVAFRDLEYLFSGVDGRTEAWSDERRTAHALKMRESWRKRGAATEVLCYTYRDKPPRVYDIASAAEALGVGTMALRNRFYRNRHGFFRRSLRGPEIWTRSSEGYDLLRHMKAVDGEPYELPRAPKAKTF